MTKYHWTNVYIALETVGFLSWDARYEEISSGLENVKEILVLSCQDRRRILGVFKHRNTIAEYHEVSLPRELYFCTKLGVLHLSYSSFYLTLSWENEKYGEDRPLIQPAVD